MKSEHREELDWLAFRYLANELSEAEHEAFEDRLAEDQTAREAVARGVELTETLSAARELDEIVVRSAEAPAPPAGRSAWSIPAAWMSVGAAACLLLVALWSMGTGTKPENSEKTVAANAKALELARAWSSARDEFAVHEGTFWDRDPVRSQPSHVELPTSPETTSDEDLDMDPMPSWMLSAVAAEAIEIPGTNESETREN